MSVLPTGASDARSPQAVAAPRDARPRPACDGTELATFARQVLVFPLLVVVLACASFLFGGTCAAWQWWTAVAAVTLVPFARRGQWRSALGAAGLFALLLFALRCLIPPFVWDDTSCADMPVYHLPMVQLLIEGWNPVADPMAEGITASLGLDLWGMAPLHVAFLPKTLAVFSAVAYTFVRDPYALTFPLPLFLWLGVFLAGIRAFRGFARWAVAATFVFVLPIVTLQMPVDHCVAFASCGLLFAMQEALRRKKCDWLALGVWAAWMMNLKLNGVLGAFVFCAAFAAATIWKNRSEWKKWIVRFAAFGCVLVALWGFVSWNPLGTSWKNFGHPLYPFKTVDAERFPVKDLTWDIKFGSADFLAMGKAGHFAHAYVSPRATVSFYRWYLNRPDFEPFGAWWTWREFPTAAVRVGLWLAFAVLLVFPAGRLWGLSGLVLMVAVPAEVIGFTRYQPWFSALGCLAVALVSERIDAKAGGRLVRVLSLLVLAGLSVSALLAACRRFPRIEYKAVERRTVHSLVRTGFWPGPIEFRKYFAPFIRNFVPRYNYLTCKENYCRLLMKELGRDGATQIEPADGIVRLLGLDWAWDEREWLPVFSKSDGSTGTNEDSSRRKDSGTEESPSPETSNRTWTDAPFGYWVLVSPETAHFAEYYRRTEPDDSDTGENGPRFPIKDVLHAWFVTYPKEVWRAAIDW